MCSFKYQRTTPVQFLSNAILSPQSDCFHYVVFWFTNIFIIIIWTTLQDAHKKFPVYIWPCLHCRSCVAQITCNLHYTKSIKLLHSYTVNHQSVVNKKLNMFVILLQLKYTHEPTMLREPNVGQLAMCWLCQLSCYKFSCTRFAPKRKQHYISWFHDGCNAQSSLFWLDQGNR